MFLSWDVTVFYLNKLINFRFFVFLSFSLSISMVNDLSSDVFKQFGRPVYRFGLPVWGPKLSPKKYLSSFFFSGVFQHKKNVEVVINDFTMHLIILK